MFFLHTDEMRIDETFKPLDCPCRAEYKHKAHNLMKKVGVLIIESRDGMEEEDCTINDKLSILNFFYVFLGSAQIIIIVIACVL